MEVKVNIGIGKDLEGEFMQHSMTVGDTTTSISRHYYKIVDE